MSRHLRTPRSNSGILFSPPADPINAKADIRGPEQKNKIKRRKLNLLGESSVPVIGNAFYSQEYGGIYSCLPCFVQTSNIGSYTNGFSTDDESESLSSLSSKAPVTLCLPSLSISADVLVDGTISFTKLTQSFYNPSELVIPEARHTFPLYDGAVVTSFECRVGDVRRLQGVVKPTAQAKREFEESKAKKREAAALLEELAPEVFETSLGNIPAKTKIEIILTYVHELKVVTSKEEKAEGLALTIPTSIAPRYAAPLSELPRDKLEITVRVLDHETIDPAACHIESNHVATYEGSQPLITSIAELGNLVLPAGGTQKMQHMWQYSSKSQPVLNNDFIFVIQMRQETRLHSRAVIAPANEFGHAALMVSLRPNDIFGSAVNPQLFKGEILFILDQSESMGWTQSGTERLKINTMKNAMSLALSGLPSTCSFNIISFGSEVRGMWLRSRGADEPGNLSYAREYLTTVDANMGGTEVLLALKGAINNCESSRPSTQIILITDGEVHNEPHDSILEFVWETRQNFGEKIRFFTLGIGDAVSHRVMEGIAELGGGYCDVVDVVKKPRWEDRVNRMLRSVMEPDTWTCDIDLGPGYERRSLAACPFGAGDRPDAHLALYAQGPYPMPSLYPYRYKSFFFLLDLGNAELPKTVTIRTTTGAAKKKVYSMDVEPAQLRAGTIHPLVVKNTLHSLEDEVKGEDVSKEQARVNAEMLGTRYSVSSRWTSFVAVADESKEQAYPIDVYKSVFREADMQAFLGSENGESTENDEDPWFATYGDTKFQINETLDTFGVGHLEVARVQQAVYASCPSAQDPFYSRPPKASIELLQTQGPKGEKSSNDDEKPVVIRELGDLPHRKGSTPPVCDRPLPQCEKEPGSDVTSYETSGDGSKRQIDRIRIDTINFCAAPPEVKPTTFTPSHRVSIPQPRSMPQQMPQQWSMPSSQAFMYRIPNDSKTPLYSPCSDSVESTNNAEEPLFESKKYIPHIGKKIRSRRRAPRLARERLLLAARNNAQEEPNIKVNSVDVDFGADADMACEHQDVTFYKPSRDGPITWEDVAGCEKSGMFVLPIVVRQRLSQHFCGKTVERLHETLRDPLIATQITEQEADVLADTLMMIQYCKTHLETQEDYWHLLISKAEHAVLLALGYDQDREEALETFYEKLLSAICHVHFQESLRHASIYQGEGDVGDGLDSLRPKTCLVCDTLIETDCQRQLATNKGFMCLADECYNSETQTRKQYSNWTMFWEHQVRSGHILCPGINKVW